MTTLRTDELDSLDLEDDTFVVDVADVDALVGQFFAVGDQPRYSTMRLLAEWVARDDQALPPGRTRL